MTLTTQELLPRLTTADQLVPWAKRLVETLNHRLFTVATTVNSVSAGGAGVGEPYVVRALSGSLTGERTLTGTANHITVADGGAGGNATLSLAVPSPAPTPGSYGSATAVPAITVDGYGRFTAAAATSIAVPASAVTGVQLRTGFPLNSSGAYTVTLTYDAGLRRWGVTREPAQLRPIDIGCPTCFQGGGQECVHIGTNHKTDY